jgi:hypothetical protein
VPRSRNLAEEFERVRRPAAGPAAPGPRTGMLGLQQMAGNRAVAKLVAEQSTDSLDDLSEEQAMKLQMYTDRYSKFSETLSNIMKKQSESSETITANLK